MICEDCGEDFSPRFEGQKICVQCYYDQHPEKDYVRQNRERLYGALGVTRMKNKRRFNTTHTDFSPTDESKGISDDELIHDRDYIEKATKSNSCQEGIVPDGFKMEVGDRMPDGSVLIKRGNLVPVNNGVVLIGKEKIPTRYV